MHLVVHGGTSSRVSVSVLAHLTVAVAPPVVIHLITDAVTHILVHLHALVAVVALRTRRMRTAGGIGHVLPTVLLVMFPRILPEAPIMLARGVQGTSVRGALREARKNRILHPR